jgi:hypothetical protein
VRVVEKKEFRLDKENTGDRQERKDGREGVVLNKKDKVGRRWKEKEGEWCGVWRKETKSRKKKGKGQFAFSNKVSKNRDKTAPTLASPLHLPLTKLQLQARVRVCVCVSLLLLLSCRCSQLQRHLLFCLRPSVRQSVRPSVFFKFIPVPQTNQLLSNVYSLSSLSLLPPTPICICLRSAFVSSFFVSPMVRLLFTHPLSLCAF